MVDNNDYASASELVRALLHESGDDEESYARGTAGAVVLLIALRRIEERLEQLVKAWG